ncbi:putative subtilisin [Trichoderma compactum]
MERERQTMRRYNDIQALLICWKDANKTFSNQRSKLKTVLNENYNFRTSSIDIPQTDPNQFLRDEICSFLRTHDKSSNLLIVYYGGHGGIDAEGQLALRCFDKPEPYAEWPGQSLRTGIKADILIILDCCHSASAVKRVCPDQDNVVYLLTACSIEGKAPLRDGYSLTHKLSTVLGRKEFLKEPFALEVAYSYLIEHQSNAIRIGGDSEIGITPLFFPIVSKRGTSRQIFIHVLEEDISDEEEEEAAEKVGIRAAITATASTHLMTREVKYIDVATNTEAVAIAQFAQPRKRQTSALYINAATNTGLELHTLTQPADKRVSGSGKLEISIHKDFDSTGRQSTSRTQFTLYFDFAGLTPRSRKMDDDSFRETRRWFGMYESFINRWDMQLRWGKPSEPDYKYRVALLCTGIDLDMPIFEKQNFDVKEFSNTSTENLERPGLDRNGFGTNCSRILCRLNPDISLCIAKITDRQSISDSSVIARGILYAVQEWRVDMIVLPFGVRVRDEAIYNAITQALEANIICLAAAGNHGANDQTAFPARMPRVIGIYSTDGFGNASRFNPSPIQGRRNFSALGEDHEFFWKQECKRRSGSEFAVCVAGGILSRVLQVTRAHAMLDPKDWKALHTPEGAEKLLDLMSHHRGGYDYVVPWSLFPTDIPMADQETVLKGLILTALRR